MSQQLNEHLKVPEALVSGPGPKLEQAATLLPDLRLESNVAKVNRVPELEPHPYRRLDEIICQESFRPDQLVGGGEVGRRVVVVGRRVRFNGRP